MKAHVELAVKVFNTQIELEKMRSLIVGIFRPHIPPVKKYDASG